MGFFLGLLNLAMGVQGKKRINLSLAMNKYIKELYTKFYLPDIRRVGFFNNLDAQLVLG